MAVITIAQVLEHAEQFERSLAEFYAKLACDSSREGVRLLTDYMSRHRKRIAESLDKFSHDQIGAIKSAPLRFEPKAADYKCFERLGLPNDATASQVLDAAVVLDECLVDLYRQVLAQPLEAEARELFESLVHLEQSDEIQLKKIKAMDYF